MWGQGGSKLTPVNRRTAMARRLPRNLPSHNASLVKSAEVDREFRRALDKSETFRNAINSAKNDGLGIVHTLRAALVQLERERTAAEGAARFERERARILSTNNHRLAA